jgi:hypothetical protein
LIQSTSSGRVPILDNEEFKGAYTFMFSVAETSDGYKITELNEFVDSHFTSTFFPRLFAAAEKSKQQG